jgi:DHA1 family inner membrane transport protein
MSETGHRKIVLTVLAVAAFVMSIAEFIVVGVLNLVANELSISISRAGQLVTAYALGISVGGPLLAAATAKMCRRRLLAIAIGVFVGANLVASASSIWPQLLAARFVMGSVHGLFIGVSSVIAASVASPGAEGKAMSAVFGGVAAATVLGVPIGVLFAYAVGWRMLFVVIAILAFVAMIASVALLRPIEARPVTGLRDQVSAALSPRVLVMLSLALLLLGGQFAGFTYISPFLHDVTRIDGEAISLFLLAYGVASAVGVFIGGQTADRSANLTLAVANSALIAVLAWLFLLGDDPRLVAAGLGVWGAVGFGLVPALQLRVVQLAGEGRDLAATFSASAVNAGVATGSLIGGWALSEYGVRSVMLVAAAICLIALPVTLASRLLKTPAKAFKGGAALRPEPAIQ